MEFREVTDLMDTGVPLFTGEFRYFFPGEYATDPKIVVEGELPLPATILAIAPEFKTNDLV